MKVEDVLSEILGVPCGNVKFTRESSSQEFFEYGDYMHGRISCYLEFTTKKPLVNLEVGSVLLVSYDGNNKYQATLLKGEETSRIVRAIAGELCV